MESNALTRLKRVAGRQTTTLTHYGRKSGQPHEVTIWFALAGEKLYIGTANVNRQWVRNVSIEDTTCAEALDQILKPVSLRYQVADGVLVLSR